MCNLYSLTKGQAALRDLFRARNDRTGNPPLCEYAGAKPRKTPKWFALSDDRPLLAFAGLWTPWRGVRGPQSAPIDGAHELLGFLTQG